VIRISLSEDAREDLEDGFSFYEQQEKGLGDYFADCLRADIEGLKLTAGIHRSLTRTTTGFSAMFSPTRFTTLSPTKPRPFGRWSTAGGIPLGFANG